MKKTFAAVTSALVLFTNAGTAFCEDMRIGTSPSGYGFYKEKRKDATNGLFRLADQKGQVLLAISPSCNYGGTVTITRHFKPARMTQDGDQLETIILNTSYSPYHKQSLSQGQALVSKKRSRQPESIGPFPLSKEASPNLKDFCNTNGTVREPSAATAQSWMNLIDSGKIYPDKNEKRGITNNPPPQSAETKTQGEMVLQTPEVSGNQRTYRLVSKQGQMQYEQTHLMEMHVTCAADHQFVSISRDIPDDPEYQHNFFAYAVELSKSTGTNGSSSYFAVLGIREGIGADRIEVKGSHGDDLDTKEFCNGAQHKGVDRAKALAWYGRMQAYVTKAGFKP